MILPVTFDSQELGFSFVEMNASCTRSKNNLKEVVAESLNNTSIEGFYKGQSIFKKLTHLWCTLLNQIQLFCSQSAVLTLLKTFP